MSATVLFLDVDMQPLRIESWQRAIADFFLGKVEVIEYSRDRTIKGVGRELPMPAVVRVLRRFRRDKLRIKFSRLNIYARDRFVCQYDGKRYDSEDLTFDHVLPRSKGGRTTWENIVTCCVECNSQKANRQPHEIRVHMMPDLTFCEGHGCSLCRQADAAAEGASTVEELTAALAHAARPLTLIKRPTKPKFLPAVTVKMDRGQVPAEWAPYWTGALEA